MVTRATWVEPRFLLDEQESGKEGRRFEWILERKSKNRQYHGRTCASDFPGNWLFRALIGARMFSLAAAHTQPGHFFILRPCNTQSGGVASELNSLGQLLGDRQELCCHELLGPAYFAYIKYICSRKFASCEQISLRNDRCVQECPAMVQSDAAVVRPGEYPIWRKVDRTRPRSEAFEICDIEVRGIYET
ncbi:hypothetical protein N7510_001390 [Penicillium lagena]|uniref:uncharacterized protein n=1 Tax=Penicillium lagena TaxID=94218 RepID=UPI00253F76D9|nr:uncharacterized protein N7510_001390 [Penicillium lagena]KAJ5625081.1 hypothetical protein N7510_001390 [Penicillium lagena]